MTGTQYEIQCIPPVSAGVGGIFAVGCLGYVGGAFAFGIVIAIAENFLHRAETDALIMLALLLAAPVAILIGFYTYKFAKRYAYRRAMTSRRDQALRAVHNAREHAGALQQFLKSAISSLDEAEQRFATHLYGPFWDSIVTAAQNIENFANSIGAIRQNQRLIEQALTGAEHTFPPLFAIISLPDPAQTISRYSALVHRGEADFNFASIWEQRRMADAIDKRLAAVIGAVQNATTRLSAALSDLQQSNEANFQDIASETRRIRNAVERR